MFLNVVMILKNRFHVFVRITLHVFYSIRLNFIEHFICRKHSLHLDLLPAPAVLDGHRMLEKELAAQSEGSFI